MKFAIILISALALSGCAAGLSGSFNPSGRVQGSACSGNDKQGNTFTGTLQPDSSGVMICTP